jgi:hypothetical protein
MLLYKLIANYMTVTCVKLFAQRNFSRFYIIITVLSLNALAHYIIIYAIIYSSEIWEILYTLCSLKVQITVAICEFTFDIL